MTNEDLQTRFDDVYKAWRLAAGYTDRFRDVVADCLGYIDSQPGDDVLIAELREHFGRTGPEPTRWREFTSEVWAEFGYTPSHETPDGGATSKTQNGKDGNDVKLIRSILFDKVIDVLEGELYKTSVLPLDADDPILSIRMVRVDNGVVRVRVTPNLIGFSPSDTESRVFDVSVQVSEVADTKADDDREEGA